MADKQVVVSGGFGLGSACFLTSVIFAVLKAAGVINWSWWIVVAPALGYIALSAVIGIVFLIILAVVALIAYFVSK